MARSFRRSEDNEDETLQDGYRGRVPLMMRDELGHRPGFAVARDPYLRDEFEVAHAEYRRWLQDAWRGNKQADAEGYREGSEGSPCTVQSEYFPDDFGCPGTIQHVDGVGLVCVPNYKAAVSTGDLSMSATEREYALYDAELRSSWKNSPRR